MVEYAKVTVIEEGYARMYSHTVVTRYQKEIIWLPHAKFKYKIIYRIFENGKWRTYSVRYF